jgi:hypothetical protein
MFCSGRHLSSLAAFLDLGRPMEGRQEIVLSKPGCLTKGVGDRSDSIAESAAPIAGRSGTPWRPNRLSLRWVPNRLPSSGHAPASSFSGRAASSIRSTLRRLDAARIDVAADEPSALHDQGPSCPPSATSVLDTRNSGTSWSGREPGGKRDGKEGGGPDRPDRATGRDGASGGGAGGGRGISYPQGEQAARQSTEA